MVETFERTGRVARVPGWTKQDDALSVVRATLKAAGFKFTGEDAASVRLR